MVRIAVSLTFQRDLSYDSYLPPRLVTQDMSVSDNKLRRCDGLAPFRKLLPALLALQSVCFGAGQTTSVQAREIFGRSGTTISASADDAKPKLTALVVGQPIERDLRSGESHSYQVPLKAGQYVNVQAQPHAIDVKIAMLDPAGKVIAQTNWEREGSTESLWVLVEVAGDYEIRITATARSWSDPRYLITLVRAGEMRTAPLRDQTYVKAYQMFWKAWALGADSKPESLRQAAEIYEQTLPLWREVKDRVGEAYSLSKLSVVYFNLHDRPRELAALNQALPIWRAMKNHEQEEANALHHLGAIHASKGNMAEALACETKALELARLIGNQLIEFSALNNLGSIHYSLGDFQAALDAHHQALSVQRAIGDTEGQARSLSNISAAYFGLGEFQEALNYCKQALPLRRAAKDRRGEAITLTNIGSNYRELGEPQIALEYYEQAVALLHGTDDLTKEAALLNAIGRTNYDLGDYSKALEYHQKSLEVGKLTPDAQAGGETLTNIGSAYARLGEQEKALKYFEDSLRLRRDIGDRRGEALTLRTAGELYRTRGDLTRARAYFDQGLQISRDIKNRFYEANFLYAIARIEQTVGHSEEARRDVEAAIDIIESTRTMVSVTDLRASFFASKQEYYELEIDLLMQSYASTRNGESLLRAFNVSERQRARTFLDNLEGSRARVRNGIAPELLGRERALRAKLNQQAENQIKLSGGNHTPDEVSAMSRKVQEAASDYDQVLTAIRSSSQHYAALTQPQPLSLSEVQSAVLDKDTVLLEYALGTDRSYVWAVTSDSITGFQLPSRSELEGLARRAYDLLTARNRFVDFERADARKARIEKADSEYQQIATELSRVLLAPVLNHSAKKRLLIVSDGALQYLSFAALSLPNTSSAEPRAAAYVPLIAKYEIVNLPSASTLGVLRKELAGRKPAPKTVAVLADPVFDKTDDRVRRASESRPLEHPRRDEKGPDHAEGVTGDELTRSMKDVAATDDDSAFSLPRLRFTRQEADAITALAPANERKEAVDFAANRATAIDPQLSQYRYVHFATHALLNNRHPELSGIILSLVDKNGNDQNGFLLANEIYNLNLPAELVILSGCKTGLGKEIKGEGIVSLTRSFMYAGAARVVVSLWDVNDRSTAELMTHFYRSALGSRQVTSAAALRSAQITMSKSARWHAPYYWAAFVLQGEYR
jgi:CHAT domain-containing protein/Tfp pilus assembly protein PilF